MWGCDVTGGWRNSSLGYAEPNLRRMNEALPPDLPDWFYAREIKHILAHGALSERRQHTRLVLPPSHAAWAAEQAEMLLAGLRDGKYDIVGELADLRPAGEAGHPGPAGQPAHPRPAGEAGLPPPAGSQPYSRPRSNSKPPCRPRWPWPAATTRCCTQSGSGSRTAARGSGPATSSGRY